MGLRHFFFLILLAAQFLTGQPAVLGQDKQPLESADQINQTSDSEPTYELSRRRGRGRGRGTPNSPPSDRPAGPREGDGKIWTPGTPVPPGVRATAKKFAQRNPGSPTLDYYLSMVKVKPKLTPQAEMQAFRRRLEAGIIGQPEVIDVFENIERNKTVSGPNTRTVPEIVYLTGLPGTGKDTAARTYVDAMHGRSGSHKNHMYYLPVAKSRADLWKAFGSNTGYVGSQEISPFIKFLVAHSGGRYQLKQTDKAEYVIENPKWRANTPTLPGTISPEDTIVYIDEFHNWSQEAKNSFFKQAFEKGYFTINNPGPGVAEIYVPVTFVIASNECIELIAARNNYGLKVGKSKSYEDLMKSWERVAPKKDLIINAIKGQRIKQMGEETLGGISEELANRLPKSQVLLLRPLSPDAMKKIALEKLTAIEGRYAASSGAFGAIMLMFGESVINFLSEYKYDAEEGARILEDRVKWIEAALLKGIYEHANPLSTRHELDVAVRKNADSTHSLVVDYRPRGFPEKSFELPIVETLDDKPVQRFAPEELKKLTQLSTQMNQRVFGVSPLTDQLQRSVIVGEEASHAASNDPEGQGSAARVYLFLGLSSTGKTESVKVLASQLPGGKESLKMFDFSSVRSVHDLKEKILGTKDEFGRAKKSLFMEHFDKHNGRILVCLDEIANAPREVLKALYDLLREPIVSTFSDDIPRSMGGVTIVATGNAGEEWFAEIPRDIPKFMQMFAMSDVYNQAMKDPGFRRAILERYFSEALLNRIGEQNIFFFPPLGFLAIRQLALLKLDTALENLKATDSRWGWDVKFASEKDFFELINTIETDGFVIREQGASIDRFVKQNFEENLRAELLTNGVSPESEIAISFVRREKSREDERVFTHWLIHINGQSEAIPFVLTGVQDNIDVKRTKETQILTGYHEVGHEIVRHALLGDKYRARKISIIPGVAKIGSSWIQYLGIAQSERIEYADPTRTRIVAELAVKLAGEAAEKMIANQATGGKSNDISTATSYAQYAIIDLGLSDRWGNYARADGQSMTDFVNSLTEERRRILEQEVVALIDEGTALAEEIIRLNYESHFIPMALELIETGEMDRSAIEAHYVRADMIMPDTDKAASATLKSVGNWGVFRWLKSKLAEPLGRDAKLLPNTPVPAKIANIASVIEERRQSEVSKAVIKSMPVSTFFDAKVLAIEGPVHSDSCGETFDASGF